MECLRGTRPWRRNIQTMNPAQALRLLDLFFPSVSLGTTKAIFILAPLNSHLSSTILAILVHSTYCMKHTGFLNF